MVAMVGEQHFGLQQWAGITLHLQDDIKLRRVDIKQYPSLPLLKTGSDVFWGGFSIEDWIPWTIYYPQSATVVTPAGQAGWARLALEKRYLLERALRRGISALPLKHRAAHPASAARGSGSLSAISGKEIYSGSWRASNIWGTQLRDALLQGNTCAENAIEHPHILIHKY